MEGVLLIMWVAIKTTSPQNFFGKWAWILQTAVCAYASSQQCHFVKGCKLLIFAQNALTFQKTFSFKTNEFSSIVTPNNFHSDIELSFDHVHKINQANNNIFLISSQKKSKYPLCSHQQQLGNNKHHLRTFDGKVPKYLDVSNQKQVWI